MQISISDASFQTQLFILIFVLSVFFSLAKKNISGFTSDVTEELKGFAILAVVFSHIGYFLVTDHQFLFPLSVLAGVGVNLFLFLSGFGLRKSWQKDNQSLANFYPKRLIKLFVPFLIVLSILLIVDKFFLNKIYPANLTLKNFFGFFPSAEIYQVVDSPLWYFSLILFYYLIAPVFFKIRNTILAALNLFLISYLFFNLPLPIDVAVQDLYKVHFIAFPLGVAFVSFEQRFFLIIKKFKLIIFPLALVLLFYTAIHSGIGNNKFIEQAISLVTMWSIITIFVLNEYQFKLFNLFGRYSYEVYLIHWPILYRYDHFYRALPASLATICYLAEFILLGLLVSRLSRRLISFLKRLIKTSSILVS